MSALAPRSRSLAGWCVHLEALLWLLIAAVALRVLPFRLVRQVLWRANEPRRLAAPGEVDVLAAAVARVAEWCRPAATCLARSVALTRVLARRRLDAALVVGVCPVGGGLAAHAWVEHEGRRIELEHTGGWSAEFSVLWRAGRRGDRARSRA